ncbi:S-adenosyl-L-methionine-dependent methyltransferase [Actinoplanes sp. OR16]|uniref:class I SAM-dependent methyltransferase n=1 Tax=Actinoplanes sp. OR16 TaxID=946334 RepID=UPI000F6D8514|nr:SAM-dependent methyltransferase [Actinoplanes sp. OR16]BBH65943.1 S-adenosyl-L-methionine-dependent methyltransferase [Actinoplanes sp. OR16]
MEKGRPSKTAWSAARYRAAHQVIETGSIFRDPLAVQILNEPQADLLADAPRSGMRLFIAARTRFAEDAIAAAVGRGVRELVILGAGLDTFAYRNPHPNLRVTEVDHPDTQEWKRQRLADAAIGVPENVRYAGVDFEKESLSVDLDGPAFFLWLGVVPYLTSEGFGETLAFVASAEGNEVAFDYAQSPERMAPDRRDALLRRAERVAKIGEPWLTYFEPGEIDAELRSRGFTAIEDLGPAQLAARYFGRPDVPPETPGGHVLHARR